MICRLRTCMVPEENSGSASLIARHETKRPQLVGFGMVQDLAGPRAQ